MEPPVAKEFYEEITQPAVMDPPVVMGPSVVINSSASSAIDRPVTTERESAEEPPTTGEPPVRTTVQPPVRTVVQPEAEDAPDGKTSETKGDEDYKPEMEPEDDLDERCGPKIPDEIVLKPWQPTVPVRNTRKC